MKRNSLSKYNQMLGLVFIFFVLMAVTLPLSFGDDLDWGGAGGAERLSNFFENYNGRYLGNLTIIAITRNMFLRVILYSVVNTGIVYLITRIVKTKHYSAVIISTLLLLIMPVRVYGQTFGWFSGFANYNMGMFFSLLIIVLMMENKNILLILGCSFVGQLFMENISIFNIISAIYCLFLFKNKTALGKRLAYLIGTVAGGILMFSNGVYNQINQGDDYYRSIDYTAMIKVFYTTYTKYLIMDNWLLLAILTSGLLLICRGQKRYQYSNLYLGITTVLIAYMYLARINLEQLPFILNIVINLMAVGYLAVVAYVIMTEASFVKDKNLLLYIGLSSGVILAPFLLINPFGDRAEFTSYVFIVILVTAVWEVVRTQELVETKEIVRYGAVLLTVVTLCLLTVNVANRLVMHYRFSTMEVDKANNKYIISEVPFPQYGQHLSPNMSRKISPMTFREKYGFSREDEIIFVPYKNNFFKKIDENSNHE